MESSPLRVHKGSTHYTSITKFLTFQNEGTNPIGLFYARQTKKEEIEYRLCKKLNQIEWADPKLAGSLVRSGPHYLENPHEIWPKASGKKIVKNNYTSLLHLEKFWQR